METDLTGLISLLDVARTSLEGMTGRVRGFESQMCWMIGRPEACPSAENRLEVPGVWS